MNEIFAFERTNGDSQEELYMNQMQLVPQPKVICCTKGSIKAEVLTISNEIAGIVPKAGEIFPYRGALEIQAVKKENIGKEAYTLSIKENSIIIGYSEPNGLYYALATLRQLALLNDGNIPCCEIEDAPDMKIRGYSDDISRGQISSFENFKEIIRRLSEIKCNLYMPYIEDTMQFDCIPTSGRFSDPVSKEEWKELVVYAKNYYVQITPIINTLGHWDKNATLQDFRELMLKTADGKVVSNLDARKQEVQDMVLKMLDEAIEVFGDSEYIHVGGDEVAEYTNQFGKDKAMEIFNGHFKMMNDYLKSKGKKMMMYSDMYTPVWGDYQLKLEAIDDMPNDITFVYWDYACRDYYKNIDSLKKHGKKFIISPATHSWNRFLPQHYASWLNTKSVAKQTGSDSNGVIMSSWCDGGMNLREENWYGLYCAAIYSWNSGAELSFDETVCLYFKLFFGIEVDLTAYHALFDYDERFLERRTEEPIEFWYEKRFTAGNKLCSAFWQDATQPADAELKAKFAGCRELFEKAQGYFGSLQPQRNEIAYEVFLFDLRRSIAATKKLELQRVDAYETREQAMADIATWGELAAEVNQLKVENEKLWMASNRQSEWLYAKSKYEDLYDSIQSVIRYCRYGKSMTVVKHL